MHFDDVHFYFVVLTVAPAAYFTTHGHRALHTNEQFFCQASKKSPISKLEMEMAARVKKFRSQISRPISVG